MADISDRLDRLQRREDFDRSGMPLRPAAGTEHGPAVVRPVGVDDRLGEVLDAVAAVVSKHPGLSVMIAVADGRAGRPVVRVTERDGGVETGVVVPGAVAPAPAVQAAAVPSTERPREPAADRPPGLAPEPAADRLRELAPEPAAARVRESESGSQEVAVPQGRTQEEAVAGGRLDGRHAAADEAGRAGRADAGWSGSSWHNSLWSAGAQSRFRSPESGLLPAPGHRRPGPTATDRPRVAGAGQRGEGQRGEVQRGEGPEGQRRDGVRGPGDPPAPPGGTIPLPEDTSQVVTRLAQLLRDNPALASSWSREAPE